MEDEYKWTCNACGRYVSSGHTCYTPAYMPPMVIPPIDIDFGEWYKQLEVHANNSGYTTLIEFVKRSKPKDMQ